MPFLTPDYRAVRASVLRDIANLQPLASVGPDSDYYLRANATGAAIEGLYQHQQWIARQIFPDTADSDVLEQHASQRGIQRKAASAATGSITFSGATGSAVPIGTEAKTAGGVAFVTTASGVIGGGGSANIAARASLPGKSGNQDAATALALTSAPSGVQSQAAITSMTGGTDSETDAGMLARLLTDIRLPPAGGAAHDYARWALEVSGVADAYVFTQRRAVNSVDVVIETAGGLPSTQLVNSVQAHIDSVRPVGADVLVMAPQTVAVNIAAALALSGTTLPDATARIGAALTSYFAILNVGGGVTRARLIALMMDTPGVVDVTLTAPASNVAPLVDNTHVELAVLGTVALT